MKRRTPNRYENSKKALCNLMLSAFYIISLRIKVVEMKGLKLNREKLYEYISTELSKDYQIQKECKPNNLTIFKFIATGIPNALLNVYENLDGTTTLHYKVGANQVLSKKIAEHLVTICEIKTFKSNSFYIKSIRDEDFDTLLSFLTENGNTIENDKTEQAGKRIIKIKGKQGDTITVTKHINNSFQVQGKPMLLFNEIMELLSELMPFKDIIEQQLSFYETNLTTADILGELENKLPTTHDLIEDKIKVILTPSLALAKIGVELDDYSAFAFPALRALEGIMKQIFKNRGIVIPKEGFGEYIKCDGDNCVFTDKGKSIITDSGMQSKICKMYKYYKIHRHALFHVDGMVVTTKIISKHESDDIITKTLEIIEDSKSCLV